MAIDVEFGDHPRRTCVVLGGRGFLGRSLVTRLLQLGNWIVRVTDSAQLEDTNDDVILLRDAISDGRASYCQVDVRDRSQIIQGTRNGTKN